MIAAVAVAAAVACTPAPGLGTLRYERGPELRVVDLATCRQTTSSIPRPRGDGVAVYVAGGKQTLSADGRALVTLPAWKPNAKNGSPGPIMPLGRAGRWVLFAIDPMGSASIIADGVLMQAVSPAGRVREVATTLAYDDYRSWCGGRLVVISGADRIATHNKRIVAAGPPAWKPSPLLRGTAHAWGSVACAPGGRAVVAQAQRPTGNDMSSTQAHWSLWRVGFDRTLRRLTSPPPGWSDDSPRFGPDGTLFFVRSRGDRGRVFAVREGKLLGPFAELRVAGYYGHHAWPYSVTR
jgi:hypothetical protein